MEMAKFAPSASEILVFLPVHRGEDAGLLFTTVQNLDSEPVMSNYTRLPSHLPPVYDGGFHSTNPCILGSRLYCIGGITLKDYLWTNKIIQLDINRPGDGWEICFELPFYCSLTRTAVTGDWIYVFPYTSGGFAYEPQGKTFITSGTIPEREWAYVFDAKNCKGWYIPCPSERYSIPVTLCATLDDGRVMVYVNGDTYFHNPVHNTWEITYGISDPDRVIPACGGFFADRRSVVHGKTVSNGILYYLRVRPNYKDESKHTSEIRLSGYDIRKGKLLFHDVVIVLDPCRITPSFCPDAHSLFTIGDGKLLRLEYDNKEQLLCYAKISVSYNSDDPSFKVYKTGVIPGFHADCIACHPISNQKPAKLTDDVDVHSPPTYKEQ